MEKKKTGNNSKKSAFNVITWEPNRNVFEPYDIMPYLRDCYKDTKKSRRKKTPETVQEFEKFVRDELMHQYWGRCQYEVILKDWPCGKTEDKIDVFEQCDMNIELITRLLMEDVAPKKK